MGRRGAQGRSGPDPGSQVRMLILTRKSGEEIRIGDRISLKIIEIRGNQVRVGIDAPRDVAVHRKEIYEQILEENRAAAKIDPEDVPDGA